MIRLMEMPNLLVKEGGCRGAVMGFRVLQWFIVGCVLMLSPRWSLAQAGDDAAIDRRVDALLAQMTMDEKIGQTVLFTTGGTITGPSGEPKSLNQLIEQAHCGGLFNANGVTTIRDFQKLAVEKTRLKIPLIFGYDVIHGYRTIFPIPLGMASSWDTNVISRAARVAAVEGSACGLNWTYSPMVDIARDPRWGRIAEGAGEDPYLGSEIARAEVRGYQGAGLGGASNLLACVKHFAAYGAVLAGRDYNSVDMSERTLREVYLPPYKAAIDAGALSVMTSFNDLNGVPSTANQFLLTTVLRKEWGFTGFVVTDYTSINELVPHGIARDDADAAQLALNAGVDMDMQGGEYLNYLKELLANKAVTESQIDEAVRRILRVKFMLGLFDDPYRYCDTNRQATCVLTPENRQAAREVAEASMVLLKNEKNALPLKPGLRLAVIGPLAKSQSDLLGCWHGLGDPRDAGTIFDAIEKANVGGKTVYAHGCDISATNNVDFEQARETAASADAVVLVLGEAANMTGEASSHTSINLPGMQSQLLAQVKLAGKPVIIVLLNGRPLALSEESAKCDALLEAWAPGTEGGAAVADVLFGAVNPSGKLPVTFPRNLGQVPIFYSEKNTGRPVDPTNPYQPYKSSYQDSLNDPLYPFGFGLSYTKFDYSDLKLDATQLKPDGTLTATVTVTNSGGVDGTETVQFYTRQVAASVTRPVLELKGFHKVFLKAGEVKDVSFAVTPKDLVFLRRDMTWGTEPGRLIAFAGPNSRDLKSAEFELMAK